MIILHTEEMGVIGGQSLRVLEDLKIIRELGHHPILACKGANWIAREARKLEIEVIDLPFKSRADIFTAKEIFKLIRHRRIDIVHTHSSIDSYLATYPAKLLRTKVVRSRHSELSKAPGHIYRIVDAIVTTGEKVAEQFKVSKVNKPKIVSIPSYPDERYFSPEPSRRQRIRRDLGFDDSTLLLGTMAGTAKAKGVDLLLEAFAALSPRYPNLQLLVAGNIDQSALESLMQQAQQHRIAEKILFLGYTDARDFLEALDLYICPSRKEGVPQALMQAMMIGKPCVSTDVGSIAELNVENNLPLVPSKDTRALTEVLQTLTNDPQYRQKLGEKNRLLAKKYFSRSVMKERMADLYESLGAQHA